ncbi:hypothetical protein L6R52_14740 [Myxococcota bacterium]|nr:hypothetical protein [Myxococcota bacterium]
MKSFGQKLMLSISLPALALSGCGLESLAFNAGQEDFVRPVTELEGTTSLTSPTFKVVAPDGNELELVKSTLKGTTFTLAIPSAPYQNLRVEAVEGEVRHVAIVPEAAAKAKTTGIVLDETTTSVTLIVLARASAEAKTLAVVTPGVIRGLTRQLGADFQVAAEPASELFAMIGKVFAASTSTGSAVAFVDPDLDAEYATVTSALAPAWLTEHPTDFDGDGAYDADSAAFDAKLAEVARRYGLDGCLDPVNIRVVFAVDFNEGRKDGNCAAINRFKWAVDAPGKSMFLVGGVHKDSAIQDPAIDASMGSWKPNTVPMYDDGTNGDAVAGDNVWSIAFAMPRGIRVAYKYTWGTANALWTGSEEWPGNQRLLEIVDVNGDNIVYRLDNWQDEATNKDKSNLLAPGRGGRGSIDWDTDANGDGVQDARERQIDLDNDCTLDSWVTPTGVGPLTVDCENPGS